MGQKPLPFFKISILPSSSPEPLIQGDLFNRWLKENIPGMRSNRYINIWKFLHKKAKNSQEILFLQEYLQSICQEKRIYNYYYLMYLIETYEEKRKG